MEAGHHPRPLPLPGLSLADEATALGLPCFPCRLDRVPVTANGFKDATRDPDTIRHLFSRSGAAAIGVPTGRASGFNVIDVDVKHGKPGMEWYAAHRHRLPRTRTHRTQNGGLHLLFRLPPGVEIRNDQKARVAPGVDVRGEGGYVIYPPTPGYTVEDDAEPAEMPGWLVEACLRPKSQAVEPAPRRERSKTDSTHGTPYGVQALAGECEAIRRAPFGEQEHTINSAGLKIGSLVAGGELEEEPALAELLAAARSVPSAPGREPWSQRELEVKVRRGFADGQRQPRQAPPRGEPLPQRSLADEPGEEAPPETPDLRVLRLHRRPPPALPLDVFGPWQGWMVDAAEAAAAPVDYVAAPLLAAVSAVIGNARWAQAYSGWEEPPHLWCVSVGDSGGSKSPGADAVISGVLPAIEERMAGDFPNRLREWQAASEIEKARKEQWAQAVRDALNDKSKGAAPPLPPAPDSDLVEPMAPQLVMHDVTHEQVALRLSNGSPKGLLMVRDELAGHLKGMNRYSEAARAFWLESYGGRSYRVDRVKLPVPINVRHLAVAWWGGTQPSRLAEIMGEADDGLLARHVWFWPDPVPFDLPSKAPNMQWAIDAFERLRPLEMGLTSDGHPEPVVVQLADDALPALRDFGREMFERQQDAGGLLNSAFGKARGLALRLSLVLEYLWWAGETGVRAPPTVITRRAFLAAATLVAEYILPMAERVYGDAAASPGDRGAATLARWIAKTRSKEVHVRALQRDVRLPGLNEAKAIHDAARALVDAGWLLLPGGSGAPGRPRVSYPVNPVLWTMLS